MAERQGQVRWARSRDRRGGADADRPRPSREGLLQGPPASNLLAKIYSELFERAGVDPAETGDVIAGCAQQFGEQGVNIGRNAWLEAGLPMETPATTIDRQCGSAQQAVNFAAALIASGVHDVAVGCGVEHMGHISFAAGSEVMKELGCAVLARADGSLQPDSAGALGGDDRRQVGDHPRRARRIRAALPAARRQGDRGGSLRARDRSLRRQRRHLRDRPGPARDHARGPGRAEARPSRRTARSPPATPPRSPTAPPPCS